MPYGYYPNAIRANSHALQDGFSSTASVVFVGVSAAVFFCFLLVIAFKYCTRAGRGAVKPAAAAAGSPALSLPAVPYSRSSEDAAARGCAVCLSEFEEAEVLKVIPACGHVFHPECIGPWLVKRRSCPVCRCEEIFGGGAGVGESRVVVV